MRDRLQDYAPDVPQESFDKIREKMLAAAAASKMAARRKRLDVLKYAAAVAVVAAAGLLLTRNAGDRALQEPVAETAEPVRIVQPQDQPQAQPEALPQPEALAQVGNTAANKPVITKKNNTVTYTQPTLSTEASAGESATTSDTSAAAAAGDLLAAAPGADSKEQDPASESSSATGSGSVTVNTSRDLNDPDFRPDPFAQEQTKPRGSLAGRLSLGASGLLAANTGKSNKDAVPNGMMMYTDRDGNIFYSMGAPTAQYHYSAPVSGGISVRYNFAGPFYAESGVRFTWLHTWVTPSGGVQDLLYAGIPLGLGVNILQWDSLKLYGSLYGMPSKCIVGRESPSFPSNYTKLAEIPIMWSAGASLGASYNFTPVVGIFAEPTVSYYFANPNAPQTMFKDTPYYFTLNLGVRFNLE